jgi:hypothetical protein
MCRDAGEVAGGVTCIYLKGFTNGQTCTNFYRKSRRWYIESKLGE